MNKPITITNLDELRALIHQALDPSLLSKEYRHTWSADNPTAGLCSVAAEAAWFVLGSSKQGWISHVTSDPKNGGTHWWLEHTSGLRFDPTEEQYRSIGDVPPYERGAQGRPTGFMGIRQDPGNEWGFERKPSKRAQDLLNRMRDLQHRPIASIASKKT